MCTGYTTDVIWMNTKVCSVTSKPSQSSGSSRNASTASIVTGSKRERCGSFKTVSWIY